MWTRSSWATNSDWIWQLSSIEIDELLAASVQYADRDVESLGEVGKDTFVLPTLSAKLSALRERLINGRGFELIRGFPSSELSESQNSAVFVGLGCHLGSARSQNAAGDLLGHVRNVGADVKDPNVRIYQTDQRQTFHTDSADLVGLMCLQTAAQGGESLLVSVGAVYNEMLDRDPALAEFLFEPVATDRRGEIPEGQKPYFCIPILNWFDQKLTVIYQRQYIDSASRFGAVGQLSERTTEALDLFDDIMNEPEFFLSMTLEKGDMQFVHNHSLLHDRTGFVDKLDSPRHLLRLWLSAPGDRELPPGFSQRYGSVTVGDRGGVVVGP